MGLPQPATLILPSQQQLRGAMRLPTVIKTSDGTADRGVWFVRNAEDLENALTELTAGDVPAAIGDKLVWHGAMSIDYLIKDGDATPLLIACNPCLR
jgi:hypothetical protein